MVKMWIEYDRKARKEVLVLFDEEDLPLVSPFVWYPCVQGNNIYIVSKPPFLAESILLHRWIVDAPDDMLVHHINHNTLDNRKENLAILSASDHTYYHVKERQMRKRDLFSLPLK
ncbi:MAG: HNH endonuclease [Dissulfurispiraceae bacterium]